MSSPSRPFSRSRPRRRIALAMVVAILLGGIAQAAHYHKDELAHGGTDVHCLLCLYAAGSASPPAAVQPVQAATPRYCSYRLPSSIPCPQCDNAASYDARGPPLV